MSWALVRVDDRLIHGQVVVAWGARLHPRRIWVADDAAAADAWERDLLGSAAPGVDVRVVPLAEAAAQWAAEAAAPEPAILLLRDLRAAVALLDAGAVLTTLNLGGLHYSPGKAKVADYVYLDDADRAHARRLAAAGVALEVQDVPATRAQPLAGLDPSVGSPRA